MTLLLLAAVVTTLPPVLTCDNKPVLMVVTGVSIDRQRMAAYAKALANSGLYQKLGGYYLNALPLIETFEGNPPPHYATIVVRFPCLANARAFWHSEDYQKLVKPLRMNPSAGDYTITVYNEAALRADMVGKVGSADYLAQFRAEGIAQVAP